MVAESLEDRQALLTTAAILLAKYYASFSQHDLLNAAIASKRLVSSTPAHHPGRARRLQRLVHFMVVSNAVQRDIEEAIRVAKQSVETTPDDDLEKPQPQERLQICLHQRYARMDTRANLIALIQYSQQAIATTPDDSLCQISSRIWLGQVLTGAFLGGHNISAEPMGDVM